MRVKGWYVPFTESSVKKSWEKQLSGALSEGRKQNSLILLIALITFLLTVGLWSVCDKCQEDGAILRSVDGLCVCVCVYVYVRGWGEECVRWVCT